MSAKYLVSACINTSLVRAPSPGTMVKEGARARVADGSPTRTERGTGKRLNVASEIGREEEAAEEAEEDEATPQTSSSRHAAERVGCRFILSTRRVLVHYSTVPGSTVVLTAILILLWSGFPL